MAGPGVIVRTDQKPAPSDRNPDPAGRYFIITQAERGPTDRAVILRGMADYRRIYGDRVTYGFGYDDLDVYFGAGGGEAVVVRYVGGAATKGFLTLVDRAGTPLNTLKIEAIGAGAGSNRLGVVVRNGVLTGTYHIDIYLDTTQVETFGPFSTPVAAVNGLAASDYVRAINQSSATAAPNDNPAAIARTSLSAGADDRASITDTNRVDALAKFTPDYGAGAVAAPGSNSSTVQQGLIAHHVANGRVSLLAGAAGASIGTVTSAATALRSQTGSEGAGYFYPSITISDGSGGVRTVSPEGYVAGRRAYTARTRGVWQPAAGTTYGRADGGIVNGVEVTLQQSDVETLAASTVNAILPKAGRPTVYGWRSLSADQAAYGMLNIRDLLNDLVLEGTAALEKFLFEPITPILQSAIENELIALVEPIAAAGGLVGLNDDPGYIVDAGNALNPPSQQATNVVRAALGVRPSGTAELIILNLTKVAPGTAF